MCVDKMNSSDPTVMEDDAPLVNSSTEVVVIRFGNDFIETLEKIELVELFRFCY